MGEKKRRRELAAKTQPIPVDIREDIAMAVRSTELIAEGGMCIIRALAGLCLLRDLGFPAQRHTGGMVYRAGPDPLSDVVAFCSENNLGAGNLFHSWLRLGDDLIDFTCGDWPGETTRGLDAENAFAAAHGNPPLPSIRFDMPPPDYLWAPAELLLKAWQPDGEPELGQCWYGPADRRNAPPVELGAEIKEMVRWIMPRIVEVSDELHLQQRVADWRKVA